MNTIVILWSMVAAACLTLSMVHVMVWVRRRRSLAHLTFACMAAMVAAFAVCDMFMMTSQTPQQYGRAMWWLEVVIFLFFASDVSFFRAYLRAGPIWLGAVAVGLRGVMLLLNLPAKYSANFVTIDRLDQVDFMGATASIAVGHLNAGRHVGEFSEVALFVFSALATVTVWRRGDRRRAILVSGSMALFMLIAAGQAWLVFYGVMAAPFYVVPAFMMVIAAMSSELGGDVIRTAQLATVVQAREEELRESERRMDLAASAAQLGLWVWDVVNDDIWVTTQGRALFGVTETERIDLDRFMRTLHPDDVDRVRQRINEVLESNGEYDAEYRVMRPDGTTRWVAARGRVDRDESGRPLRMLGVSLDITQRRLAEERSQSIVEASPSSMVVVNHEGVIMVVNAQTERTFGYTRQELIGQKVELLLPVRYHARHEQLRDGYLANPSARAMGAGRELFGRRKDGRELPVEVGLTPIQMLEGRFVLASIVDISERKRVELELARQRNELAHLSRVTMLGELSGSLAHELNQPLASILSNAQAAQRYMQHATPDLDEVRDILQDIVDQDRRAGQIISRLRSLLHRGEVNRESVELNQLIHDALNLIRSDMINQSVRLEPQFDEGLPLISGDTVQLQQVLINLVMNGCDAMAGSPKPDRRLIVRTTVDGSDCHVEVVDHGTGVPDDQLEAIFTPFFTTKSSGMGLGLAVCRTIVDAHGGRLWATNNADRGATIHFTLPIAKPGDEPHEGSDADSLPGG
ncbi:MAG: PAS domain S-box protein [Phycisphaera sp.]|nr:PAS domain S-box protein [Phycisphaera sp.]